MATPTPSYEIDARWKIVRVNEAFCRALRCTETGVFGRDIRDLIRDDWRLDFRAYVARALVGVGDGNITLPIVAPCGAEGWFKHTLEPIVADGLLAGYRATVTPHLVHDAVETRWWNVRMPPTAWNFDSHDALPHAS